LLQHIDNDILLYMLFDMKHQIIRTNT